MGSDFIELAIIDGWQCVVKKGEFKPGNKGLYFEIDSFVPASDERFKFLEKTFTLWKNNYGARIKTIKLRSQVSQGLLLPLDSFMDVWRDGFLERDYAQDLGVIKWERDGEGDKPKPQQATWLGRKMKKLKYTKLKPFVLWLERKLPGLFLTNATRPFPNFIRKTDEERIQNIIGKLDPETANPYEATVKLDGQSMTVYKNNSKIGVCSRNWDLKKDHENRYWAVALNYKLDKALKKLGRNIALQGELMGPGIQGNREGLNDYKYYIYKIWDIDAQKYLNPNGVMGIVLFFVNNGFNIDMVPSLGLYVLSEFATIEDYLTFAEGPSLNAPTREGVVFTDAVTGERGFKVIANSYLLKEDK